MDIIYRNYQPSDAKDVKTIIEQGFDVAATVNARHLHEPALQVHLRERLANSTWAQVAVANGKVVGLLCGRIPDEPRVPGRAGHLLSTLVNALRIAVTGIRQYKSLAKYTKIAASCKYLQEQTKKPTRNELTLFAVGQETRGMGIGSGLFDRFQTYLRSHGCGDFFLFTDDKSSYGFYESRGMQRAAVKDINYRFKGKPFTLKTMLYTGNISSPA